MKLKDQTKRDRIFEASLDLVNIEGLSGLTMAKLAKKAGMATGTLYIYFKNKEELFVELYRSLEKSSYARFLQGYNADGDFKEGLKTLWINYMNHRIRFHRESIFLEQYYRSTYSDKEVNQLANTMKQPIIDHLNIGIAQGIVTSKFEPEMMFYAMLGFIRELAGEHDTKNYPLSTEKIEQAFEFSYRSILIP